MSAGSYPEGRYYEIRDPVHVFIRLDERERALVDSAPFQRLRDIHQLGMTYLVYPGATRKRFEHSLGTMELASRIFDVIAHPQNREHVRGSVLGDDPAYWRRVLRAAALCHDLGHLPFSHAAEKELLPPGYRHEHLTISLIESDPIREILEDGGRPPLKPADVAKLAVKRKHLPADAHVSDRDAFLSEIINGDVFGADRMDYLLRDSLHAGVAYGRFDHHRLIETLRLLPVIGDRAGGQVAVGVEWGGLQSAEALLVARYFMYQQVYFHPARRAYDLHYRRYMQEVLGAGAYPISLDGHLSWSDSRVMAGIQSAARDVGLPGHPHARRTARRDHFRVLYERNPEDVAVCRNPGTHIAGAAARKYGAALVDHDALADNEEWPSVPVLGRDGTVRSAGEVSNLSLPVAQFDYVLVDRRVRDEARAWLCREKTRVLRRAAKRLYEAEDRGSTPDEA